MDHIPRPYGIELTEADEVPYVASEDYLGIPFADYPKTSPAYQVATNLVDAKMMCLYEPDLSIAELERFLQTWLFFGLLQETLGEEFTHGDFVQTTDSKTIISTKRLLEKLRTWIKNSTLEEERVAHLRDCLQMALLALHATPISFDLKLKVAIAATAEVISCSLALAAKTRNLSTEIIHGWGDMDDINLRAVAIQEQYGWCSAQAMVTLEKFKSLQSRIFISKLTKPQARVKHDACAIENCAALQIDPSKYNAYHRHEGFCQTIRANQEDVVRILKTGNSALLDVELDHNSGEVTVAVVPAQPNSRYIALSHVWADGLGNPIENSLPRCQIRWIYDLITGFCKETSTDIDQERPYLWVDTLCCPVDPDGKLLALALLPGVYRDASQVLVLDSSLTGVDSSPLQPIEIMARVFSSGWIYRLWTLNEANLASKILIQFRDRVIDLDQVFNELSPMAQPETYNFTSILASEYGKLRMSKGVYEPTSHLWYLTESLKTRSVSEISDEPICTAALLQLDVEFISGKEIVGVSASQKEKSDLRDKRMVRLWNSIGQSQLSIPKALIYYIGDRLREPGLRWAPSTLLHGEAVSQLLIQNKSDTAILAPKGLVFFSSACSVAITLRVDGILGQPSTASSRPDFMKYSDGRWATIFSTTEQMKYPSNCEHMTVYDIMVRAEPKTGGQSFEILFETPEGNVPRPLGSVNCLLVWKSIENQFPGNVPRPLGSVNCLLVWKSIENQFPDEPDVSGVRFIRQGLLSHHSQSVCEFLDLLLEQAQQLQRNSVTHGLLEANKSGDQQDPVYLQAFERLKMEANAIVDRIVAELDASGTIFPDSGIGLLHHRRQSIFSLLSRFYRNRYLLWEQDIPSTQIYCLD